MNITITENEKYIECQLDGRFVAACVDEVAPQVEDRLGRCNNLLFDLSKMSHIDSSALGFLVRVLQKCRAAGGTVRLASLQPHPKVVFDITKVYRVFEIFDSVEEARKAFEA